jgi:hypothetical protein
MMVIVLTSDASREVRVLTALGGVLDWLGTRGVRVLVEAAILLRAHPHWAVWAPTEDRGWTAVRPASSRPPSPDLPMVWVQAGTAGELAGMMRAADDQLFPGVAG